ncbi:hypothetical protein KJ662_05585 [Patescibacteria group bacterium]|nr:hypothetical protein [Patescibacteria group bacterium]
MSNTVTSLTATLIQDEVLPALKLGLSPLNAMSITAVADRPLFKGDAVTVDVVTAKSAGTYATTFESGDSTWTGTAVTIAAPVFSSWHINPFTEGAPTAARFLAAGKEAAYAVAKTCVQNVLAFFVNANVGSGAGDVSAIAAASYDTDDIADMIALIQAKGVAGSVSAIHNLSYATALKKDAALKDASAYGGGEMIRTGTLPPILGVQPYYTDAFPAALTNENVGVIFTGKTAAAVAIGAAGDPTGQVEEAGVREMIVTDPESGLSLTWRTWVNSGTGYHWGSVYVMMGQSFLQNAAVRIVSV